MTELPWFQNRPQDPVAKRRTGWMLYLPELDLIDRESFTENHEEALHYATEWHEGALIHIVPTLIMFGQPQEVRDIVDRREPVAKKPRKAKKEIEHQEQTMFE